MPVYEYYCDRCQHKYEAIRPVSRMDEAVPCPKCNEPGRRQLSAFAFRQGRYGHFVKSSGPTSSDTKPVDKSEK